MPNFPLPKGYSRLGAFPLDDTAVFNSLAALITYAGTGTAYAGQLCSVSDGINVSVYKINVDKSVTELSAQILVATAETTISGHRVVVQGVAGSCTPASSANILHINKVLGITTGAVVSGQQATIIFAGPMTEPTWTWVAGDKIFFDASGVLTTTAPTAGFAQQIGFATSATTIQVQISTGIVLT